MKAPKSNTPPADLGTDEVDDFPDEDPGAASDAGGPVQPAPKPPGDRKGKPLHHVPHARG